MGELSSESKAKQLLENPQAKAVLEKYIPEVVDDKNFQAAGKILSLKKIWELGVHIKQDESVLALIDEELKKI